MKMKFLQWSTLVKLQQHLETNNLMKTIFAFQCVVTLFDFFMSQTKRVVWQSN